MTTMKLLACLIMFAQDPWAVKDLIQPQTLATQFGGTGLSAPTVIFVGFPVLYRGAHIPGAILAGPGTKTEGIEALKNTVREWPRNREIVLYCGCCPFVKCSNVRPAYAALHEMGFSHLKLLVIDTNFHTDWVAKGYPVQKGG